MTEHQYFAQASALFRAPGPNTDHQRPAVTDAFGNPAAGFRGAAEIACDAEGLPVEHRFTDEDAGSRDFAAVFPKGVVSRVRVTCGELAATSNPVLPREAGEPGIWFGDIHAHCEISGDGAGGPDSCST